MPVSRIQIGQIWRRLDSEETFLVTRLYDVALATFAVLRPTGSESAGMVKVKIARTSSGQTLPGFSMAQEADDAS
jgi:hypothetical protein